MAKKTKTIKAIVLVIGKAVFAKHSAELRTERIQEDFSGRWHKASYISLLIHPTIVPCVDLTLHTHAGEAARTCRLGARTDKRVRA